MKNLSIKASWTKTFPFNTDGIDVSGRNFMIDHCKISTYDDAIAIKPLSGGCTENVTVLNTRVKNSVGISIGSIAPTIKGSCIQNVVVRNAPGTHGSFVRSKPSM